MIRGIRPADKSSPDVLLNLQCKQYTLPHSTRVDCHFIPLTGSTKGRVIGIYREQVIAVTHSMQSRVNRYIIFKVAYIIFETILGQTLSNSTVPKRYGGELHDIS